MVQVCIRFQTHALIKKKKKKGSPCCSSWSVSIKNRKLCTSYNGAVPSAIENIQALPRKRQLDNVSVHVFTWALIHCQVVSQLNTWNKMYQSLCKLCTFYEPKISWKCEQNQNIDLKTSPMLSCLLHMWLNLAPSEISESVSNSYLWFSMPIFTSDTVTISIRFLYVKHITENGWTVKSNSKPDSNFRIKPSGALLFSFYLHS